MADNTNINDQMTFSQHRSDKKIIITVVGAKNLAFFPLTFFRILDKAIFSNSLNPNAKTYYKA